MATETLDQEWSETITVAGTVRVQALGRVAVHLGSDIPTDKGIILQSGDTMDVPAGDFKARAIDSGGASLFYQEWTL